MRFQPSTRSSPTAPGSDKLTDLATSSNSVAAGFGEIVQALVASSNPPNSRPIMVEFGNRTMAIGRQRMQTMNGRNAFLYMKSKFGLLNATSAFFLEATFEQDVDSFVEIDLDSWEELVAFMHKIRIIS
ncbi:hypothetical protein NLJ89_g2159 [Agrocybe chaxingu]|uniref:Uncharacterized protein n=1 Tax=Agrocybe chaxingu TaxID=84603 RepID=A0A9W8K756_9AGAR|nr:hypothetical protein NLJ89_g2159 [Agrocybe chaxingu]